MIYGKGISHIDEVLNIAVENDYVLKSGAWFSYNGEKIGQGLNAARAFVETHPDVLQELENKIHDLYFGKEETVSE